MCSKLEKYYGMTNTIVKVFFLIAIISGAWGCAPRTASPSLSYTTENYTLPEIPLPQSNSEFTFIIPQTGLEEIKIPTIEISDKFSYKEINHVRACDNKLFAKNSQITLDLEDFENCNFVFPLPGGKVISPYGGRRKYHSGVDIKTRANDTIVAAFDGIVRMSKPYSAYGNVIVIRHYNGLETVYSHNSKNLVKPGDRVKAGTPIGLTGRTGRATTEHVHFETRIDGEHFDPSLIIDFTNRQLKRNQLVFTQTKNGKVAVTPAMLAKPIS